MNRTPIETTHRAIWLATFTALLWSSVALAQPPAALRRMAGADGVVYAVDARDRVLVDIGSERSFLPASTLKLFTVLLAIDQLGADYRFRTELYLQDSELVVRGFGDPFLVSEELDRLVVALAPRLRGRALTGVAIDDSFFSDDVRIPGVGRSSNPYDALNAAVSVNFNTVAIRRSGDRILSGEAQTPLTPFAEALAKARKIKGSERIQLGDDPAEIVRYSGELIAAKLRAQGISVGERVSRARAPSGEPLYVHLNSRNLAEVCRNLLEVSNNFVANQVFLAVGAAAFGPPASLSKSRRAAERLIARYPQLAAMKVVEGSGIAYQNQVTAPAMTALLRRFEPYRVLLKTDHGTAHKTGTLKAIATVAGYLEGAAGPIRYVVAVPGDRAEQRWRIVDWLRENL